MKKYMWIIIFAVAVIAVAVYFCVTKSDENPITGDPGNIMDGPGMEYSWVDYELYNTRWIETNVPEGSEAAKLEITKGEIRFTYDGVESTFQYSLPPDVDVYGKPEEEVYLTLEGCDAFESFIFHEEKKEDGGLFPVLSGTLFEYDGRGEIVVSEFVLDNYMTLPEGFESETLKKRNYSDQDNGSIKTDGAMMAYNWIENELYGEWIEAQEVDYRGPAELTIDEEKIELRYEGVVKTFQYSVPEDVMPIGIPEGEVYLKLTDCDEFESLIFHEEGTNHTDMFPVLSGTIFEYDGRGEIIITEYVRKEKTDLPKDFESESLKKRNYQKAVPMVKE